MIWLLKELAPDFKTIADFRKNNKVALKQVFKHFVLLCKDWGLFSHDLIALDGSKYRAWSDRKQNFNMDKLEKKYEYIDAKINDYLERLDQADQEDGGPNLKKAEIVKKIQELKERKKVYESYENEIKEKGETQYSVTDPDSRSMVYNQRVEVCYNVQTTVESQNCLIIDYEATNQVKDHGQLSKMSLRAKSLLGVEQLEFIIITCVW